MFIEAIGGYISARCGREKLRKLPGNGQDKTVYGSKKISGKVSGATGGNS